MTEPTLEQPLSSRVYWSSPAWWQLTGIPQSPGLRCYAIHCFLSHVQRWNGATWISWLNVGAPLDHFSAVKYNTPALIGGTYLEVMHRECARHPHLPLQASSVTSHPIPSKEFNWRYFYAKISRYENLPKQCNARLFSLSWHGNKHWLVMYCRYSKTGFFCHLIHLNIAI